MVSLLLLAACNNNRKKNPTGTWRSEKIEPLGNHTFGKRVFHIADTTWQVQFTLYLDSEATKPVFTFRGMGTYTLGRPSVTVQGATEAVFYFAHKYLTLHTSDTALLKSFGFTSCNLTPEEEKDITETGCSFLESKSACSQEYDLVRIKNEKLYFRRKTAKR